MIELNIQIRAKDHETVQLFTELMIKQLTAANQMGEIDVTLSAEKNGDTITLVMKEILKFDGEDKKDSIDFTPIKTFIEASNLSVRIRNALYGIIQQYPFKRTDEPFKYAEDITKEVFLKLPHVGQYSWDELAAELKRQNIKY